MKMTQNLKLYACTALLAGLAGSASADIIFSDSFENPVVVGFSNTNPTGWTESGISTGGGINNESVAQLETPFGAQALWTNGNSFTTTSAILSDVLTAGVTYTLTVNLGKRTDVSGGTYTIDLLAGTTVLDTETAAVPNSSTNFSKVSTIIFTPNATHAALLGQTLAIRLDGTVQTHFDNVQLDAVPEPGSLALLGLGGLLMLKRRRGR